MNDPDVSMTLEQWRTYAAYRDPEPAPPVGLAARIRFNGDAMKDNLTPALAHAGRVADDMERYARSDPGTVWIMQISMTPEAFDNAKADARLEALKEAEKLCESMEDAYGPPAGACSRMIRRVPIDQKPMEEP